MASVVLHYCILIDSCDLYLCKAWLLCYGLVFFALLEFSFVPRYSYWEKIFNKTNLIKVIEIEIFQPVQIVEECEHFSTNITSLRRRKQMGSGAGPLAFPSSITYTKPVVNHVDVFTFPSVSFCVRFQFYLIILVCSHFLLFLSVYDIVSNWFFLCECISRLL